MFHFLLSLKGLIMALYKAVVGITYTETPLPSGTTVSDSGGSAQVRVTLTHKDTGVEEATVTVSQQAASYTFENIPEGSYTVSAVQLDDTSTAIGTPASVDFVVSAPPVATFFAPSGVTVAVSPM